MRHAKLYPTQDAALSSKKGRTGAYAAQSCTLPGCEGGFHLVDRKAHVEAARKQLERESRPPRDTGPSAKVRAIVLERDGYKCARCGKGCGPGIAPYSLQHRKARGVGGDSSIPNLVLLCGTATTRCHGEVEGRQDPHDQARGYRLESWQEPGLEPVMYFDPSGGGFTAWLAVDGSLIFEAPAAGAA